MPKTTSLPAPGKTRDLTPVCRTTVALPAELLRAADDVVRQGRVRSRNELNGTALRRELALLEQTRIEAEFQAMGNDTEYQREFHRIQAEFATADRETLDGDESAGADATKR